MEIVSDEPKRIRNFEKHRLDFFADALIVPAREHRLKAVGFWTEAVIAVVFAILGAQGISVISLPPASRQERRPHEQFQSGDQTSH
jgi:uncharacterized DUF497 family protein